MRNLTEKQKEILDYIETFGGNKVQLSAGELKQNKNFYFRVKSLIQQGLIVVERREGLCSLYTLTEKGTNIYKKKVVGFPGIVSDWDKGSPVQRMRNQILLSDLDKGTKDRLLSVL